MLDNSSLLFRLILRRDRVRTIIWAVCIFSLVWGFALAVPGMYTSDIERIGMAETLKNPAMVAMMGPVYDEGGFTVGALYNVFMLLWTVIIVGILNIFLVVRHTRQDEERGRVEVIRSLPVGRMANLAAVLSFAAVLNLLLGLLSGVGLAALGLESMGLEGSLLFGAAISVTGMLFAAVTAVFCQLCSIPQTAQALAFAFMGGAYFLRAMGDMQSEVLACISPLGLVLRTQAYTANEWWPIPVMLAESAVLAVLALWLCSIRDMGAGLVPAKPGRRNAVFWLSSAEGLAWRLLRVPFLIWAVTLYITAAAYGSVMGDMEEFLATNEMFKAIVPDGDPAKLISFLMVIMSLVGTIPILQFMLKARSQEKGGYAENVLVRAISRHNQLFGYLLIALVSSVLMPILIALGFYTGSTPVMEDPISLSTYMEASLVYIPAVWVMLGLTLLLIAYLPRWASLAWVYLGYAFLLLYLGSAMDFPEWMHKISPYGHVPQLPAEEFDLATMIVMSLLAAGMMVLSFIGHRRRDMKFS